MARQRRSYQRILEYYKPKILPGLTATPAFHDTKPLSVWEGRAAEEWINVIVKNSKTPLP
jgi:hypothetical protein